MPTRLSIVFLVLCVALLAPSFVAAQGAIAVHVTAEGAESGFSSGKGTNDSVADLTRALGGKKRLSLVSSADAADVVIEVESRDSHWDTGGLYKYKTSSGKDAYFSTSKKERVVYATLKVGDYTHQFHGQGSTWTSASESVAKQVDKWVQQNVVRIVELRQAKR